MNGSNAAADKPVADRPWLVEIATLVEAKIGAALSTINATAAPLRGDMEKLRKEIAQRDAQAARRETQAAHEAGRREVRIIMSVVVTVGVAATVLGFLLKGGDSPSVQTPPVAAGGGR